jgi:hypothetical protein
MLCLTETNKFIIVFQFQNNGMSSTKKKRIKSVVITDPTCFVGPSSLGNRQVKLKRQAGSLINLFLIVFFVSIL